MKLFSTSHFILFSSHVSQHSRTLGVKRGWHLEHEIPLYLEPSDAREWACLNMLDLGVLGFYFKAWGSSNQHLRIEYLIFNLKVYFLKWYVCILLGMYIVAFSIGFLFWKSCKSWRRLGALDYIWKSGVGFTLFYFTDLFVEILGRKGSGTMIFIVSWCYGGLAMVVFILFWQGSYPPWWHHTGIFLTAMSQCHLPFFHPKNGMFWISHSSESSFLQRNMSIHNSFYGLLMSFAFLRCFRTCQSTSFFLEKPFFSLPETVSALTLAQLYWWEVRSSPEKGALSGAHSKEPSMQSGNCEIPQNFPFFGARWAPTSFEWNYGVPKNGLLNGSLEL